MVRAVLVISLLLLAGCLQGNKVEPESHLDCTTLAPDASGIQNRGTSDPALAQGGVDPRQPQQSLFVTWGWPTNVSRALPWDGNPGPIRPSSLQLYGNGTSGLLVASFDPFGSGTTVEYGPAWIFEADYADDCVLGLPLQHNIQSTLVEGDLAQVGQGVRVLTAGFWENGTLFYTNIEGIDASDVPRAGWYAWGGADPLNVYVYDQDRAERPAHWGRPTSQIPPQGAPIDDVVLQAASIEASVGIGYSTTIRGFNEALKGLSTTTSRVVHIAAEDAYTQPGNEDHVLYGDDVIFILFAMDVVATPCPGTLDCDLPV